MNPHQNEPEYEYGHYVVAFLDLLGHKERLREIEGVLLAEHPELLREKLQIVLKDTVGSIWTFRRDFSSFFEQFQNRKPSIPSFAQLDGRFSKIAARSKLTLQNFSDSTIAWSPVKVVDESQYPSVLNSIFGMLAAVAVMTPVSLARGVPFRGGIDLEGAIPLSDDGTEIYGPALNCAYGLESKEAKYPRVLVGPGLLRFLRIVSETRFRDDLYRQYCLGMVSACRQWIVVDDDGKSMIHFLGQGTQQLLGDFTDGPSFYRDVLVPMQAFIRASEERFCNNPEMRDRYRRLKSYCDKYVKEFTGERTPN